MDKHLNVNKTDELIPLYIIPGMAASVEIFENILFAEDKFSIHFLPWEDPINRGENLEDYCYRCASRVKHDRPVLLGVSFGGVVAQEMAKYVDARLVVIISSIKTNVEFPRRMKLARATGLHRMLPTSLASRFKMLKNYTTGKLSRKLALYDKYLHKDESIYLDWALDRLMHWDRIEPISHLIHIQGTADPVFPIRYMKNYVPVQGGTHIMIINRFRWFNEHLTDIILSELNVKSAEKS